MSEYTPTTSEVREQFARGARGGYGGSAEAGAHRRVAAQNKFDRWLAAHDREVAEKAWDEGFMRANRLVNCRMCRGTTVPKINPYTV